MGACVGRGLSPGFPQTLPSIPLDSLEIRWCSSQEAECLRPGHSEHQVALCTLAPSPAVISHPLPCFPGSVASPQDEVGHPSGLPGKPLLQCWACLQLCKDCVVYPCLPHGLPRRRPSGITKALERGRGQPAANLLGRGTLLGASCRPPVTPCSVGPRVNCSPNLGDTGC